MTHHLRPSLLRQPLRKKLFLLLFIGSVGFPALSQSFAYHAPETNSIQEKGQLSLKDALLNLENRFRVVLGYKKNLVHNQTVADGTWQQEKDFELALKELLAPLNLMYKKIGDKTYVIKAKPKETSPPKKYVLVAATGRFARGGRVFRAYCLR